MQLEFPGTWQCIHSLMKIAKQAIGINPDIGKILLLVILSFFGTEKNPSVRTLASFNQGLGIRV
jgi:hypothetical protein